MKSRYRIIVTYGMTIIYNEVVVVRSMGHLMGALSDAGHEAVTNPVLGGAKITTTQINYQFSRLP